MSYPGAIYPGTSYPAWAPVAPGQMRTRLVSYIPFGPAGTGLPDALESQVVTPLGELPTAQVHYHREGVNAVQLDGMVELGFEYYSTLGWVEPPNCRFLSMKGSFDHLEQTPTRKYSFIGVGWMLRQAKVWEANGLQVDADGKVQFLSANAGQIMATLIGNAQVRGWGAGVSIDFDSTADSSGQAWGKIITIAYDLDLDLETVLANLYQQGVCDYRWEGRTLRIFNPETTMAQDLTVGASPVRLVVNDGQTSAPEEWTNEDLLTHAMVLGEDGKRWEFANGANNPLGRLEKVIAQGGVSDEGTASLLAQTDLLAGSETQISFTREFVLTDGSVVWPYRTYALGDWVLAQRGTVFERLRTVSLSLTVNADGVKGHAVLGTRLQDLLTKLAKRTKGITGGASAGGSGARPAPEGPDLRTPDAPAGLVVQVDVYLDNAGFQQGLVNLDWAHTGTATDGTVMDVSESEVYYRVNEQGQLWRRLLTVDSNATEATQSGLPIFKADGVTPEQYGFKVRAVGGNRSTSTFSNIVAVTMAKDTTAPPVPLFTADDLSTWLRTVKITFDGKTGAVASMPLDYAHANVYQGSSSSMTGAVVVGQITGDSLWQSGSMPLATVWYALTAVDRAGNESELSAVQSVTPTQNVDVSEIADVIDAAQVRIDNAGKALLESGQELSAKLSDNDALISETARGLPTTSTAAPVAADGADKKVNATWRRIDGAGNQIGFWRWTGTAWASMPLDKTIVPVIDIGTGTAGDMGIERLVVTGGAHFKTATMDTAFADMFSTRKLTAENVLIGNPSDFAPSLLETPDQWELAGGMEISRTALTSEGYKFNWVGTGGTAWARGPWRKVSPGDKLYAEATSDKAGGFTGGAYLRYNWYDQDKQAISPSYTGAPQSSAEPSGTRYVIEEAIVPAGAAYTRFVLALNSSTTGNAGFFDAFGKSMTDGNLVATGSITAPKIVASESMSAKLGQFLHVSTNMLDANAVTADKANIGSLVTEITTTNALRSKLVIGPDVRTTDAPAITGGMQFYSGGLRGWDSNGRQTLGFSPVTGKLFTEGDISTGRTGRRAEMYDYGSYAGFRSWADNDSDSYMELYHAGANPHQTLLSNVEDGTTNATLTLTGMASLASGIKSRAISFSADDSISLNASSTGLTYIHAGSRQDGMEFGANSFGAYVSSGTIRATSTSLSANMYIGSSGQMYHTTSTAATKAAIAPAPDITDKLLGVDVRTWFDMGQSEAVAEWTERTSKGLPCVDGEGKPLFDVPDTLRPVWGVVAEELANAGLGEFLHYNGDGTPAGVMYDRLAVALIPIIRWQHGQIQCIRQDIGWLKSFHETYKKGMLDGVA